MFCSTVIPTVGRPTLGRAVDSVLNQSLDHAAVEIIVVNDSGAPLPAAGWQRSDRVRVIDTCRRERSVARNTGAAIARGRYLHFLDDDDWLAPCALQHLRDGATSSTAAWIYGHSTLVDGDARILLTLRPALNGNCFVQALAGEWIPLQASLIDAETFFAVGGFNPRISGPEDVDLLRRVTLRGTIVGTPHVVAQITWRTEASTTDYERHPSQSRWARESILNQPRVLARMRASAGSSYWQGRIVRAYATSVVWNLRQHRYLTAASRAVSGLTAFILAGPHAISSAFWRAVARPHASATFIQGLHEANRLR
jgi:glycosyltransferase involved in cell wall biosynthesis